ncbi:uncharacterized protein [Watersipora subatra]|uniref:uncharacterized protein n=1 Tax=Watersipora subatra TaxID=2589382 RepID=UPI00355C781A
MVMVYGFYMALAAIGIVLNIAAFILRLYKRQRSQLDEHHWCLLIHDILFAVMALVMLGSLLQDVFKESQVLCHAAGFLSLYVIIALSWTPLVSAIVLYEKERYSLRVKSYEGMTTKIVTFLTSALLLISAALVSINYAPIMNSGNKRHLLCVPMTFPYQDSSEYSELLVALVWSGLLSTWACLLTWLVFLLKNNNSMRHAIGRHKTTRLSGIQAVIIQTIWTAAVSLATAFYWTLRENLLLIAVIFAIMMVIGHPLISLISHWLADAETELFARLAREVPSRLMDLTILSDISNHNFQSFHALWMGKCGEKIQGVIKVYKTDQRSKWLREIKAFALLAKTEHPNIVKYLWAERGGSFNVSENMAKEYMNMFTDPNNRMISIQTCDRRSLQQLIHLEPEVVTDTVTRYLALDVALGLVHLRTLRIVHNNLSSKTIFIKSSPKHEALSAVIGDFEESGQVAPDHCANRNEDKVEKGISKEIENRFSVDIRSYALVLLEMVASWNKHNGRPIKPTHYKRSSKVTKGSRSITNQKQVRATPPVMRYGTLSQKPKFGGILEEPPSNGHIKKFGLRLETSTTGIEDVEVSKIEGEDNYEFYGPHALGVIIPHSTVEQTGQKRYYSHPAVTRQGSGSICSTDTGYPTSLESHPIGSLEPELVWPSISGKTSLKHTSKTNVTNSSCIRVEDVLPVGVVQLETNYNNNIVSCTLSADASVNHHPTKYSPHRDSLCEYEEYDFQNDPAFSELTTSEFSVRKAPDFTEKTTFNICNANNFRQLPSTPIDAENLPSKLDLAELAEKVTQDVEVLLKTRSRPNSEASNMSTLPNDGFKPRSLTLVESLRSASASSEASQSAVSMEDNLELYINEKFPDTTAPQSAKLTCLHRSGITGAQLNYSKALANEYDIVTPHLLYLNASSTRRAMKGYREQLAQPTLSQLLVVSEGCWLQDPALSADSVLTQLRQVFILS